MLTLAGGLKIFLRREPTDMRLGYEGLSALARNVFGQSPTSGHLFVFVNRSRNRSKMLLWDNGGFWLCSRRLEQGTFAMPSISQARQGTFEIDRLEWISFLEGIIIHQLSCKKRYVPLA